MRLTVEDNPESIKRYGHVKAARGRSMPCARLCPGSTRTCSREKGHHGPHVTLGAFNRVLAVWDGGGTEKGTTPSPQVSLRARRSSGARRSLGGRRTSPGARGSGAGGKRGSSVDFLEALRSLLQSSPEEAAWLLFFIAFVAFAIGGFMLILLG